MATRFGTATAVKEGIKAGLGISILSSRALDTEVRTGIIKALKVNGLSMFRKFFLIGDRRRIGSPLCQVMLDFLLAAFKEKYYLLTVLIFQGFRPPAVRWTGITSKPVSVYEKENILQVS